MNTPELVFHFNEIIPDFKMRSFTFACFLAAAGLQVVTVWCEKCQMGCLENQRLWENA